MRKEKQVLWSLKAASLVTWSARNLAFKVAFTFTLYLALATLKSKSSVGPVPWVMLLITSLTHGSNPVPSGIAAGHVGVMDGSSSWRNLLPLCGIFGSSPIIVANLVSVSLSIFETSCINSEKSAPQATLAFLKNLVASLMESSARDMASAAMATMESRLVTIHSF